jgi:hypothetical protein
MGDAAVNASVVITGEMFRAEMRAFLAEALPADMLVRTRTAIHPWREDILAWREDILGWQAILACKRQVGGLGCFCNRDDVIEIRLT